DHDTALIHDFSRIEDLAVGPVLENKKRRLEEPGRIRRNGELIDGFVERGVGVEVRPESYPDRFQILDQVVLLEMGRAVEGRMLDEMRIAQLVRVLENGAGVDRKAKLGP